jgi:Zn-dependent protease
MNLLLALATAFAAVALVKAGSTDGVLFRFLDRFFSINLLLAVFNLIPLPPLDGSRLLTIFLPPKRQNVIFFLDRYGFIILLGLVFFGGLAFLDPLIDAVGTFFLRIAGY